MKHRITEQAAITIEARCERITHRFLGQFQGIGHRHGQLLRQHCARRSISSRSILRSLSTWCQANVPVASPMVAATKNPTRNERVTCGRFK
ncbi:MAG: hypothetical protein ACOY4D_10335 [Pseudomonadota bacterium]